MSQLDAANDDPNELLAQVREAWRTKQHAESNLGRMRKYKRTTDGMKSDRARHEKRLADADAILRRILGAAA